MTIEVSLLLRGVTFVKGGVVTTDDYILVSRSVYTKQKSIVTLDQFDLCGIPDHIPVSGRFQIQANGTINMPLIGPVPLAGLTAPKAKTTIEAMLADGYLKKPDVTIEIEKYRSFYVMGEVKSPGQYEYIDDISALKAVAMAGD